LGVPPVPVLVVPPVPPLVDVLPPSPVVLPLPESSSSPPLLQALATNASVRAPTADFSPKDRYRFIVTSRE
jgi:hypothetical protein